MNFKKLLFLRQIIDRMKIQSCFFMLLVSSLIIMSCKKESSKDELPPVDTRPSIVRTSPSISSANVLEGESIDLSYQLADNQWLKTFKIIERINDNDRVLLEEEITGTFIKKDFTYTVPQGLNNLTIIKLIAFVYDNKMQFDSTVFVVTKDFIRDTTELYNLLSYQNDTIYSNLSITGKNAFNCIARTNVVNNNTAKDIQENSQVSGNFLASWISPNTNPNKNFVVLNTSQFNFEQAKYSTIDQAFRSNTPKLETGTLRPNDIVILKSRISPHYIVFKINAVVDGPGDEDYITFDYKRSN